MAYRMGQGSGLLPATRTTQEEDRNCPLPYSLLTYARAPCAAN